MAHAPGFLALVNDAKSRVQELSIDEVRAMQTSGAKFVLVDVREDNEWAAGHIVGAVHIGRGILERDIEQAYPDHAARIVLYCGGGFRSALAADNLKRMGYTNVASMDGGFRDWSGKGLPIE
jgi:rhodanese-related sulfurtransferase